MKDESRTIKSLKNVQVSMFYYVLQMILGFWSRKVYLDCLGIEVLGLNTTATNLFGFLNLAELGVGAAVLYFLYDPLNNDDYQTINKNVALQGWIYRRIAYLIIGGAFILMAFFPLIFKNMNLPMWYAYATFSVMLFSSMLGYFINYKSIVLNADQKGYKVTIATRGFSILIKIIEIIFLPLVANPFVFTLFTSVISTIFGCLWLNHILKKEYPWLKTSGYKGKELLKELPGVLKKTKQLFIHKLSTVILFQVSPLIMYAYSSLAVIGCYGNYNTILNQVSQVVQMVFASVAAGIGSLIATKDNQRIFRVFWELYDSRFCFISITLVSVYLLIHPFFALWIGKQYIMGSLFLSILVIETFIRLTRTTVDHYINGYGLFQDVWAPFVEMCINIFGAIGFGYLFGITGVIMGSILSQLLIVYIWKPYMLFKLGIKRSPKLYFIPVIKRHLIVMADVIGLSFLFDWLLPTAFSSYFEFILYGALTFIVVAVVFIGEFSIFSQGMRDFNQRLIKLFVKRRF